MEFDVNNAVYVVGSSVCWCFGIYFSLKWVLAPATGLLIQVVKKNNGILTLEDENKKLKADNGRLRGDVRNLSRECQSLQKRLAGPSSQHPPRIIPN